MWITIFKFYFAGSTDSENEDMSDTLSDILPVVNEQKRRKRTFENTKSKKREADEPAMKKKTFLRQPTLKKVQHKTLLNERSKAGDIIRYTT